MSRRPLISLALAISLSVIVTTASSTAFGHHLRPPFEVSFPVEAEQASHYNDWGNSRPGGRAHRGNDLMAPKMTGVYAFADGIVGSVSYSPRPGRYVRIEHPEGWTSYYMHLNNDNFNTDDNRASWHLTVAPGIEEGAEVRSGQLIGWVGDSGNAEGSEPHLHFELRYENRPINPYPILAEKREEVLEALEEFHEHLVESLIDQFDG